ncbi:hypothetical protein QQP08_016437, partial [Theobroma cacao]
FGCKKKRQKQLACWEDAGGRVSSSRSSPPPSTAVHPCNVKLSLDWTPLSKTRDRERNFTWQPHGGSGCGKEGDASRHVSAPNQPVFDSFKPQDLKA